MYHQTQAKEHKDGGYQKENFQQISGKHIFAIEYIGLTFVNQIYDNVKDSDIFFLRSLFFK